VVLTPSESNGLKKESLLRLSKIATIEKDLVLGKLGELKFSEIKQVNSGLKQLLQL
jgi:mRNA interferase MazF